MFKNILWDLNGALFDTYPAVTYSLSKALNEMGFSVALNVIDGQVRQSVEQGIETLSLRFKLDSHLLRQKYIEAYRRIPPANQRPFPGARDVCEHIHRTGGSNIAVTDSSLDIFRTLLEAHQFSTLIDDIYCIQLTDTDMPGSSILKTVLDEHLLNPKQTLLVGTREMLLRAGRTLGMRTCRFGNAGPASSAEIRIESFSQLLEILAARPVSGQQERKQTNGS